MCCPEDSRTRRNVPAVPALTPAGPARGGTQRVLQWGVMERRGNYFFGYTLSSARLRMQAARPRCTAPALHRPLRPTGIPNGTYDGEPHMCGGATYTALVVTALGSHRLCPKTLRWQGTGRLTSPRCDATTSTSLATDEGCRLHARAAHLHCTARCDQPASPTGSMTEEPTYVGEQRTPR